MDYTLKEGVIVLGRTTDTENNPINRFQVKILPDHVDIPIDEYYLLPQFSNFFVNNNIAYQPNDVVWLLTNDDYHIGFILGLKQPEAGEGLNPLIQMINSFESDNKFSISSYSEISISRLSDQSIQFTNVITGCSGFIYNNRVFIYINNNGEIRVKNPGLNMIVSERGEIKITGKSLSEILSSKEINITTSSTETVGSKTIKSNGMLKLSSSGDYQRITGSNSTDYTALDHNILIGKHKNETIGLGSTKKIVAVGESTTVLAGAYSITVALGTISLTTGAGSISLNSGLTLSLNAGVMLSVVAPITKFPSGVVAPTGSGPFCSLPFCLFSGAPHVGSTLIGI
jgi:hypothetical protein